MVAECVHICFLVTWFPFSVLDKFTSLSLNTFQEMSYLQLRYGSLHQQPFVGHIETSHKPSSFYTTVQELFCPAKSIGTPSYWHIILLYFSSRMSNLLVLSICCLHILLIPASREDNPALLWSRILINWLTFLFWGPSDIQRSETWWHPHDRLYSQFRISFSNLPKSLVGRYLISSRDWKFPNVLSHMSETYTNIDSCECRRPLVTFSHDLCS